MLQVVRIMSLYDVLVISLAATAGSAIPVAQGKHVRMPGGEAANSAAVGWTPVVRSIQEYDNQEQIPPRPGNG